MGGVVSAGEDNDNLIDNLVEANYIRTSQLIEIFRAVDRGQYYLEEERSQAYHDSAWRFNHLHLSAPCIYSEVMEHLDLQPGMSFLNLGSGTGYLSTMAGLLLGSNGINHGIEIYDDVVGYSRERLKEFMQKSPAFDRFEFCEPKFSVGNCLLLPPDTPGYDRVYCGAACPPEYANYLMNLLNIGGKLVLPLEDQLQVKTRINDQEWHSKNALAVSFAQLIEPDNSNNNLKMTKPPERNTHSLQELCRFCIRRAIRNKFKVELPPKKKRVKRERHRSVGIEENITARRREFRRLRRRRLNTTGESGTRRRRRMNTTGDDDHAESSSNSDESSDGDHDIDEVMERSDYSVSKKAPKPETSATTAEQNIRETTMAAEDNTLAEDTNDITLSDPDNESEGNSPPKPDDTKESKEDRNNGEGNSRGESSSASRHSSKRYRFRFLRSRPNNNNSTGDEQTQQGQGDDTSTRTIIVEENTDAQPEIGEGEDEGITERRVVRSLRPSRFAYALMRGLRRIREQRSEGPPTTLQEMLNEPDSPSDRRSENDEIDEPINTDSDSENEEFFKPLAETSFTIAVRKLPLPPKLISFMLYNRQ